VYSVAFLARGPPPKQGQKEIPEGAPGCLAKKTFVITGVLESLDKDDARDLIMKYGGFVTFLHNVADIFLKACNRICQQ